jgi:importin subunit alpha-6/7
LTCNDPRIIIVCLEALENILKIGDLDSKSNNNQNAYADFIEEAEGIDKIEQLQTHQNNEIYEKAVKILEQYFSAEQEDIQNVAPNVGGFQFNFTNPTMNQQNNFNF